jgi:hypothetical protein
MIDILGAKPDMVCAASSATESNQVFLVDYPGVNTATISKPCLKRAFMPTQPMLLYAKTTALIDALRLLTGTCPASPALPAPS